MSARKFGSPRSNSQRVESGKPLDEGEGFSELGKARFFGFELAGVDAAAQAARADRMLQVQHLVVEQVFDGVTRAGGAVEDAAHDDGVVRGVVVAERAPGVMLAPGEVGTAKQAAEEARVERVEDLFEMKIAALWAKVALAAARGADEIRLARDGGAGGKALVAQIVRPVDGFAVELGEKDVRDGVMDRFRRAFKQIGEAGEDCALAQADGGVERGEAAKAHMDGRHGRARAEGAVLFLKDGSDVEGHEEQNNSGAGTREQGSEKTGTKGLRD